MKKIKPCPFCGSGARVVDIYDCDKRKTFYEVICYNLKCYLNWGTDQDFETEKEAINKWNNSITNPKLKED